nr:SpoIIE family protein phosphatase [Spirochaetaceae bacterium]
MSKIDEDKIALPVLETAIFGLIVFDFELKPVYINDFTQEITGILSNDIIHAESHALELIIADKDYVEETKRKLSGCFDTPFNDLDIKIINEANKKIIPARISGYTTAIDGVDYIVMIIQDESSRKAYETMLENSFDNFIQTTNDLDSALKKIKEQQVILEDFQFKTKQEMMVAKTVQKSIIPQKGIRNEFLNIQGRSIPSEDLGGDYFDYFNLDKSKQGILLCDVSGHGIPSALVTTMLKVSFQRHAGELIEPDEVFSRVNKELTKTLQESGFFCTAFYSVIDMDTMEITSSCAGHDAALAYHPDENKIYELGLSEKGTIIGPFSNVEFEATSHQLVEGTKIIYFTDGITEARKIDGEFFTIERLNDFITNNHGLEASLFIDKLYKEVNAFYEGAEPNDDRTVIVIDVLKIPRKEDFSTLEKKQRINSAFQQGRKYIKMKQFRSAAMEFEKILELSPESFGAYSNLG